MSVEWMSWVFSDAEVTGSKRLVLLALANHADGEGTCWPGIDRLAREARLSRRRAEDALRGLVEDGFVVREINGAPGSGHRGHRTNLYRLHRPPLTNQAPTDRLGVDDSGPPESSGVDGAGVDDLATRGGRSVSSGVDAPSPQTVSRTISEPSEQNVTSEGDPPTLQLVPDTATPSASELSAERFEEHFWPNYPRRNGKRLGKPKALAQWQRLSIEDQRRAVRGLRNYADACNAGKTLAKDAHRWLRDRDWKEWLTPADDQGPTQPERPKSGWELELEEQSKRQYSPAELGLVVTPNGGLVPAAEAGTVGAGTQSA